MQQEIFERILLRRQQNIAIWVDPEEKKATCIAISRKNNPTISHKSYHKGVVVCKGRNTFLIEVRQNHSWRAHSSPLFMSATCISF